MNLSRKIGGEMAWPVESGARSATTTNSWISLKPHHQWLNSGRSALAIALKTLRKAKSCCRIWIPTFICPSVPETCAAEGYEIRFYAVNERLQIISHSTESVQDGEALLYVHYFGFLNVPPTDIFSGKKLWIIEDAVQAAFTEGIGTHGHFVFNSLRKLTPLPDGAWLGSDFPLDQTLEEPDPEFLFQRMKGKKLKAQGAPDVDYLRLFEKSEVRLDHDFCQRAISEISQSILAMLDPEADSEQRRKNFSALLMLLPRFPAVCPLFNTLPLGIVPLGLPVTVGNGMRDALRQFLIQNGIFCPIHWKLSPSTPLLEQDAASSLSNKILTFPIDQRYTEEDMEFIATVLCKSQLVF